MNRCRRGRRKKKKKKKKVKGKVKWRQPKVGSRSKN